MSWTPQDSLAVLDLGSVMTTKEEATAAAVEELTRFYGCPPTVRELGNFLGLRSSATVQHRLDVAIKKGLLSRRPNKTRSVQLTGQDGCCPMCGKPQ